MVEVALDLDVQVVAAGAPDALLRRRVGNREVGEINNAAQALGACDGRGPAIEPFVKAVARAWMMGRMWVASFVSRPRANVGRAP